MVAPALDAINNPTTRRTHPKTVTETVTIPLINLFFKLSPLGGPKKARQFEQMTRVKMMATRVSRRRIWPKRVKSCISVASSGMMARMVVMAELKMDTPMYEMAAITLFTRGGRALANWR